MGPGHSNSQRSVVVSTVLWCHPRGASVRAQIIGVNTRALEHNNSVITLGL